MKADVDPNALTLEARLQTETRTCSQCRFVITNPFLERCPRCLNPMPVEDPGCSTCVHNSSCPVSGAKE
jgi:uncharacterized paraquat-inducible protein A